MSAATCAVHREAPSMLTCRRCGRFCCGSCVVLFETCRECSLRQVAGVPPLEPRSSLAVTSLVVSAAGLTLLALLSLVMPGPLATGVAWFYRAQFLISAWLVCRWFHLAVRHGIARGAGLDGLSAGEAVRSWFIPYVNFWRPFALLRELFQSASVGVGVLVVWQLTWIASSVGHVMFLVGKEHFDLTGLMIFSGVSVVAALSGALAIHALKWPLVSAG